MILDDTSELPPMTPERREAILAWYRSVLLSRMAASSHKPRPVAQLRLDLTRALMRPDLTKATDEALVEAVRKVAWEAQSWRALVTQAIPPKCGVCWAPEEWFEDYLTWICFCGVRESGRDEVPSP